MNQTVTSNQGAAGRILEILRGAAGLTLFLIATVVMFTPFLLVALVKLVTPSQRIRRRLTSVLINHGEGWSRILGWIARYVCRIRLEVSGLERTDFHGAYLVVSNHQSWTDIPVLVQALHGQVRFPRFFTKRELLWVPIIGFSTWAMDYPIMRRYSKKAQRKNPKLKNVDVDATRRACAKYAGIPVTVLNFAEGTRSTRAKRATTRSPYRHLLLPKSGGLALAIQAMDGILDAVLDVTIAYPGVDEPSLWDYCCGRIPVVYFVVRTLDVPASLREGDYSTDPAVRQAFQDWLNKIWAEKDQKLDCLLRKSI